MRQKQRSEKFSLSCHLISLCRVSLCQTPPGGMSSKSKQQVPFLLAFSSQNNLIFSHPDVSTQIRFCSVLWNISFFFFFCPTFTCTYKKAKLEWLNDLLTQFPSPRGRTLRRDDGISVWLHSPGRAVGLLFSWLLLVHGRAVEPEQCPSLSVHWGAVLWHR